MDDLWLYVSIFALCYIWSFFGLPYTVNKRKLYLYPAVVAVLFCLAVVAIKHYNDLDRTYRPVYKVG